MRLVAVVKKILSNYYWTKVFTYISLIFTGTLTLPHSLGCTITHELDHILTYSSI